MKVLNWLKQEYRKKAKLKKRTFKKYIKASSSDIKALTEKCKSLKVIF